MVDIQKLQPLMTNSQNAAYFSLFWIHPACILVTQRYGRHLCKKRGAE